ncbi:MAG TPA: pyruvate kinase [Thermoplasmata archaeon]|nr:pyruvate kinase [Thermoplasmata archaeon]
MRLSLPYTKTKIVCTIGPASRKEQILKELVRSGMSIARLNLTHGSHEEHKENVKRIREVSSNMGRVVAILADLPGPKIRIGKLKKGQVTLKKGSVVYLTTEDVLGTEVTIPVEYKGLPECISKDNLIYINDGFIQLQVQDVAKDQIKCKVLIGGELLSYKGLNVPEVEIPVKVISDKDLKLIDFALEEGIDAIGISFVEGAKDIIEVKEYIKSRGKSAFVIAKIERGVAVDNIDEILEVTDGVMVARGDLGVEEPIEKMPEIQKRIIHKANIFSRPVITATQMLESMTYNVRPTRAEVTDVANAILDGTDAIMLSEETAIGKYPVESVEMMSKIAVNVESKRSSLRHSSNLLECWRSEVGQKKIAIEDVIPIEVFEALNALPVKFVLTPTRSGSTPRRISRFKPKCWVLSFSGDEKVRNSLAFSYGVYPFLTEDGGNHEKIINLVKSLNLVNKGDEVILTEGSRKTGGTNSLKILIID